MFARVICLSGECRVWSSVRPQLSQLPEADGAAPDAGLVPDGVTVERRGDRGEQKRYDERSVHALLTRRSVRGKCIAGSAPGHCPPRRRNSSASGSNAAAATYGRERDRAGPDALRGGRSAAKLAPCPSRRGGELVLVEARSAGRRSEPVELAATLLVRQVRRLRPARRAVDALARAPEVHDDQRDAGPGAQRSSDLAHVVRTATRRRSGRRATGGAPTGSSSPASRARSAARASSR